MMEEKLHQFGNETGDRRKQEKINMDNGCDLRSCAECDNFLRNVGYCRKRNGFISKDEVEGKK